MSGPDLIGVVWDFDNVLHSFKHMSVSAFRDLAHEASAMAIVSVLPDLKLEEAYLLQADSYKIHNDSFKGLAPRAAGIGLASDDFQVTTFQRYHANLYDLMMKRHKDYFDHMGDAVDSFRATRHAAKHGILTHSDIETWCAPIMTDVGLISSFEPHAMFGGVQTRFANKSVSSQALGVAFEALGVDPKRGWFADDTLPNLEPATEIAGAKKVYIHNGSPLEKLPTFVDFQFAGPKELNTYLAAHILPPAPRPVVAPKRRP